MFIYLYNKISYILKITRSAITFKILYINFLFLIYLYVLFGVNNYCFTKFKNLI